MSSTLLNRTTATKENALTDEERDVAYHCFDTEDFRIGYRAFLAKTTPRFVGR